MRTLRFSMVVAIAVLVVNSTAAAHCDGMDGPVVVAARRALDSSDVNLVLIWIQQKDEAEVQRAFQSALKVRSLGPQAKELADQYFFETVVRLHRTAEGAAYTGLKPAGRDLGSAIPAADKALAEGSSEPVQQVLANALQTGLREHFEKALGKKKFRTDDLAAGREYVEAYVEYVHYVEKIYQASARPAQGHFREAGEPLEEAVHAEHSAQDGPNRNQDHR